MGIFDKDIKEMEKSSRSDVYNSDWMPLTRVECRLYSREYAKNVGTIKLMENSTIKLPFAWSVPLPYENRHCSNEVSGRAKSLADAKKYVEALGYWTYPKKPMKKRDKTEGINMGYITTFAGLDFSQKYLPRTEDGQIRYEFFRPGEGVPEGGRIFYTRNLIDSRNGAYISSIYEYEIDEDSYDYYIKFIYANGVGDVAAIYDYEIVDQLQTERQRAETAATRQRNVNALAGFTLGTAPVEAVEITGQLFGAAGTGAVENTVIGNTEFTRVVFTNAAAVEPLPDLFGPENYI